jgi:hypothetical protein
MAAGSPSENTILGILYAPGSYLLACAPRCNGSISPAVNSRILLGTSRRSKCFAAVLALPLAIVGMLDNAGSCSVSVLCCRGACISMQRLNYVRAAAAFGLRP